MTYNQYRKRLLASYYSEQLTSFINQFDPNKKTVFLLSGGMGSNLNRTEQPYPTQDPNLFDYQVWLGLETLSGGNARYIQIDRSLADGEHFVVGACGPISIFGLSPYHKFIEQGKANWNLFICGFDWRRSIEDSAKFFTRFMRDFAAIVKKEFGYKTSDITLVAHSMGGLVLTYALLCEQHSFFVCRRRCARQMFHCPSLNLHGHGAHMKDIPADRERPVDLIFCVCACFSAITLLKRMAEDLV